MAYTITLTANQEIGLEYAAAQDKLTKATYLQAWIEEQLPIASQINL